MTRAIARCGFVGSWRLSAALVLGLLSGPASLAAQDSLDVSRRATASRQELEATLKVIDELAASEGYSGDFREAKLLEAMLIRERLAEGDFQVGDQLVLASVSEQGLNGNFTVQAGRVLVLPNIAPIPMKGVLRSEAQGYLQEQLRRYIKDPDIRVQPMIRLSIMGGVGKPGFFQLPADQLLSEALMGSAGIGPQTDLKKAYVTRGGEKIVDEVAFETALAEGTTLDRLNLRAGDEIFVSVKSTQSKIQRTQMTIAIFTGLIATTFWLTQIVN